MAGGFDAGGQYSPGVAFIYLFNLVVGTGVLALPAVLSKGGLYLGVIFLAIVAFLSFVSVTFVVEASAATNALLYHYRRKDLLAGHGSGGEGAGAAATTSPFEITERTEVGDMAELFFSPLGRRLFYLAMLVYLYGDLCIYATYIPESFIGFLTEAFGISEEGAQSYLVKHFLFDIVLGAFTAVVLPFCFFDFQKTKLLQFSTLGVRNAALWSMMAVFLYNFSWASVRQVPRFHLPALPNLFGGAVYSFMCHHSLPGIITPISDKSRLYAVLGGAMATVFSIYLALFISAVGAFGDGIKNPITFNFEDPAYGFYGDALLLFPVFTLSTNFPLIAITLRNTVGCLFPSSTGVGASSAASARFGGLGGSSGRLAATSHSTGRDDNGGAVAASMGDDESSPLFSAAEADTAIDLPPQGRGQLSIKGAGGTPEGDGVLAEMRGLSRRRIVLSLAATVPPIALAFVAHHAGINANSLVGFTGSYGGVAVMFIIPASLVIAARRRVAADLGDGDVDGAGGGGDTLYGPNVHASPFRGRFWPVLVLCWAALVLIYITYDHVAGAD